MDKQKITPLDPQPQAEIVSLRDLAAMAALTGLLANPSIVGYSSNCGWAPINCEWPFISAIAYINADAMIAARKVVTKRPPPNPIADALIYFAIGFSNHQFQASETDAIQGFIMAFLMEYPTIRLADQALDLLAATLRHLPGELRKDVETHLELCRPIQPEEAK